MKLKNISAKHKANDEKVLLQYTSIAQAKKLCPYLYDFEYI